MDLRELLKRVIDWRGLDGDGITDPLREDIITALSAPVQRYTFDTVILGRPVPTAGGKWVRYDDVYGKKGA